MRKMPPEKVSTNQPKYLNVQAEQTGGKYHLAQRVKQLAVVPNVISSPKRKITSNIGRRTKAAQKMTENR